MIVYAAAFLPGGTTARDPAFWIPMVRVPDDLLTSRSTTFVVSYKMILALYISAAEQQLPIDAKLMTKLLFGAVPSTEVETVLPTT